MIATSGAVAAHQIPRMLLVARVAEFDAVGGYSLTPRGGGLGWGDNPGHSQVKTRSAVHARPTRIHVAVLPGKPDLANKARRWAIFVHGCFWRSHDNRALASKPGSNTDYWSDKLARNQARDAAHEQALLDLGFDVLTVWECETRDGARLEEVLTSFFGRP
jgi:DNA mismatch endonuclease (patch repair protein)